MSEEECLPCLIDQVAHHVLDLSPSSYWLFMFQGGQNIENIVCKVAWRTAAWVPLCCLVIWFPQSWEEYYLLCFCECESKCAQRLSAKEQNRLFLIETTGVDSEGPGSCLLLDTALLKWVPLEGPFFAPCMHRAVWYSWQWDSFTGTHGWRSRGWLAASAVWLPCLHVGLSLNQPANNSWVREWRKNVRVARQEKRKA